VVLRREDGTPWLISTCLLAALSALESGVGVLFTCDER
jgi:hypothetical protein